MPAVRQASRLSGVDLCGGNSMRGGARKWLCSVFGGFLLVLGASDGIANTAPHIDTDILIVAGAGLLTVGAGGKRTSSKEKD